MRRGRGGAGREGGGWKVECGGVWSRLMIWVLMGSVILIIPMLSYLFIFGVGGELGGWKEDREKGREEGIMSYAFHL